MQGKLIISPDVLKALREGTAVVALESTIISHGMPYPQVVTELRLHGFPGKSNVSLKEDCGQDAPACLGLLAL